MKQAATKLPSTKDILSEVGALLRARLTNLAILVIAITTFSLLFSQLLNFDLSYESLQRFANQVTHNQSPAQLTQSVSMALVGALLILTNLFFMLFLTAILILTVIKPPKTPLSELFLQAHPHVLPLFTTALLSISLFLGGLGALVLPGLALFLLLVFEYQVVVLKKQKNWQALQTALTVFWRNKSYVFSKLVVMAVVIVVLLALSEVIQQGIANVVNGELAAPIINTIRLFTSAVQQVFTVTTLIVLFKIAEKNTDLKSPISLSWLKIICAIGYIGLFFMGWWILQDLTGA